MIAPGASPLALRIHIILKSKTKNTGTFMRIALILAPRLQRFLMPSMIRIHNGYLMPMIGAHIL